MRLQMNPTFETFFLLLNAHWGKKQKKETIRKLDDFGINGAAFYAANFAVVERYYGAFSSRMDEGERAQAFDDMCDELAILLVILLVEHPAWLSDFDAVSDEEAHAKVREGIAGVFFEGSEDILAELETSELPDKAKWQIAALLQEPKQKLAQIIASVQANLAASEYALEKVEDELAPLLARFGEQLENGELSPSILQTLTLNSETCVVPSIAAPMLILGLGDCSFFGLLLTRVFGGPEESLTETEAVLISKSLSDASKVEILRALRTDKLYNIEIAQRLGLTPATASHHMNMLLSAGLVELSKEGAKVYYRLCTDSIRRYRSWLDDTFLQG